MSVFSPSDPHAAQPVKAAGLPLKDAKAAMIMVHGRGASADSILTLAAEFEQPDFVYLAPQAAQNTWYPYSFLAPIPNNEPGISSGIAKLANLVDELVSNGVPHQSIFLLGFSQGACLALEFAARHARRYGGVIGLSGGLIGPDDTPRDYAGSLNGTPIFLGCSDVDFHIPKERVLLSAEIFESLGGNVTTTLYPGMGHSINQDEINFVKKMMSKNPQ